MVRELSYRGALSALLVASIAALCASAPTKPK